MTASKFCKACGKPIEWHPSATSGALLPIDPDPHPDGPLGFDGKMRLAVLQPGTKRRMYKCHYDTCTKGLRPEPRRELRCFRCQSTEHLIADCPDAE